MLQPIMSIRDWLKAVQLHMEDNPWLSRNENNLHAALKDALHKPPTFHEAVELLMLVFPHYALVLFHSKRWMPLIQEAFSQAQDLRDNEMQIRILTLMGESHITGAKNSAARQAFKIALERAKDGQTQEMEMAAYIGLIRVQYINIDGDSDPELFVKALKLEKQIDDLGLKAALHEAISLAYIKAPRTTTLAIGHGQTAYVYWYRLENKLEMAKTAYILSAAYRFAGQLEPAKKWLERASALFEKTDYSRQHTMLAYEQGSLHLQQKDYEAAEQWLNIALEEAIQIGSVDYEACAYHGLGIAQSGLGQFAAAEKNLERALKAWETVGDRYELASAYHAIGHLHHRQKNFVTAREWFNKGLEICKGIPQQSQREFMEKHIHDTLDEIPPTAPA
jgi:tetratricopeptide (TPR) repeat protein